MPRTNSSAPSGRPRFIFQLAARTGRRMIPVLSLRFSARQGRSQISTRRMPGIRSDSWNVLRQLLSDQCSIWPPRCAFVARSTGRSVADRERLYLCGLGDPIAAVTPFTESLSAGFPMGTAAAENGRWLPSHASGEPEGLHPSTCRRGLLGRVGESGSSSLSGAPDFDQGTLSRAPNTCVLLAVLGILFRLDQVQGLLSDFLILHFIVELAKSHNDIVTNQRAVLLRGALSETTCETFENHLQLCLPWDPHLPYRLQAVPRRDEPLISRDREKSRKILRHSVQWIALGQVAEHLGCDGPLMVVLVMQVLNQLVPDLVRPVDSTVRYLEDLDERRVARISILRAQIVEAHSGGLVHVVSEVQHFARGWAQRYGYELRNPGSQLLCVGDMQRHPRSRLPHSTRCRPASARIGSRTARTPPSMCRLRLDVHPDCTESESAVPEVSGQRPDPRALLPHQVPHRSHHRLWPSLSS